MSAHRHAAKLDIGTVGPMLDFVGYTGDALVDHLMARHRQGCLICGDDLAHDEPFEICHIEPLRDATDAASLARLMALDNTGLAHARCNRRLGGRPLR